MTWTHHPRTAWEKPARPISGPAPKQTTRQGVCHWDGDDVPNGDPVTYLQNMQDSYISSRGYSVGYWAYVERNGDAWQIRGPHGDSAVYNAAANPGDKVSGNANDWTYPLLFEAQYDDFLTDAQCHTAKTLWAAYGITERPIPHSAIDYTACPGDNIRSQIAAGALDPMAPPLPPPVTPPKGSPAMFFFVVTNAPNAAAPETWLLCDGTQLAHVVDGHGAAVFTNAGAQVVRSSSADQTEGLIKSCRTTNDCPPEWRGTGWQTMWDRQAL